MNLQIISIKNQIDTSINKERVDYYKNVRFVKSRISEVFYDFFPSNMGTILLAVQEDYVCFLGFVTKKVTIKKNINKLQQVWGDQITKSEVKVRTILDNLNLQTELVFSSNLSKLPAIMKGTPFQIAVWKEILKVKIGGVISYKQIAEKLGRNGSSLAVGAACSANYIAYIVPCHRVIYSKPYITYEYKWGGSIKKKFLDIELR